MKRQSVGIQSVIIGGIIALVSSIIGGVIVSILTKNNEIETRLFEIKYKEYSKLSDELIKYFNSDEYRENYKLFFNIRMLQNQSKVCDIDYRKIKNNFEDFKKEYDECIYGNINNCKLISKDNLIQLHKVSNTAFNTNALQIILNKALIIPSNILNKILAKTISGLEKNENETYNDLCKNGCNLFEYNKEVILNQIINLLSSDLQRHFKE